MMIVIVMVIVKGWNKKRWGRFVWVEEFYEVELSWVFVNSGSNSSGSNSNDGICNNNNNNSD